MRVLATAMLAFMAAVFVAAAGLEATHPAWRFVKAFAEAGVVGGVADWFAVTALFRHPLGLPIPHTAIVPRNKDRIGDALASFLKDNFLTPSVVARRMRNLDVAGAVGRFLAQPPGEGRLRAGGSRLLADIWNRSIRSGWAAWSRPRSPSASAPSRSRLCSARRWRPRSPRSGTCRWSTRLVAWAGRTLDANEDLIRAMVHKRAGWILRMAGLDDKLADAIVDGLRKLSIDMAVDPDHPVRAKAEEGLASLAPGLQHDPETMAKVEAWKSEMIENEAVSAWLDGLWEKGRAGLLKGARDPDAALAGKFGEALRQLGETLQAEPRLKTRDQPVRAPRHGRPRRLLRRWHRQIGLRDGARLGRRHRLGPARRRGRPRPPIYPHQRHFGRRPGRPRSSTRSRC